MSQGPCRPVLRCCVNYGASVGQYRGPFSSRSCRHLFCLDWTSATRPWSTSQHIFFQRLQSVTNAAAQLIFPSSKFDHVTPVLRQLHWLKVRERIDFKLAVLVYKCLHGLALPYLIDELCLPGRRCSCLEQYATARHFCPFSSRFCISAENPLLLRFLSRTVLNVQCL